MELTGKTVVVVEDAVFPRRRMCASLRNAGAARVLEARNGDEALAVLKAEDPDVMVLDLNLVADEPGRGLNGLDVVDQLREESPGGILLRPAVVVVTAHAEDSTVLRELEERGIGWLLAKPVPEAELVRVVARAGSGVPAAA